MRGVPTGRILPGRPAYKFEVDVLHVREADLLKAAGATAGVLEVHLLEPFGGDLHEAPLVGALLLRVEEPGGVLRGKGDGQLAQTCVVGGADGSGVADAGAGVDDDAVGGRRPLPRPGADLGLPAPAHL
nr:hypothetical protein [uncultured bacterium]